METKQRPLPSVRRAAVLTALALIGTTAGVPATQPAAQPEHFVCALIDEYLIERGGELLAETKVYACEETGTALFLGPELEQPLLLNPGEKAIQTFPPAVMVKLSEEEYQLPSEIDLELVSKYRFEDLQVIFMLGEQETRLKRKPALLGFHDADKLQELRPKYRRRAADYTPAPEPLAALLKHPVEVKVLTYFGTWCPICSRLVPRLLRLDAELKGSNFRFEFFGLPQPPEIENDPVAQRENIKSLPTAVVSVDQKEIGRLGIRELHRPEVALLQLLTAGD